MLYKEMSFDKDGKNSWAAKNFFSSCKNFCMMLQKSLFEAQKDQATFPNFRKPSTGKVRESFGRGQPKALENWESEMYLRKCSNFGVGTGTAYPGIWPHWDIQT